MEPGWMKPAQAGGRSLHASMRGLLRVLPEKPLLGQSAEAVCVADEVVKCDRTTTVAQPQISTRSRTVTRFWSSRSDAESAP